MARKINNTVWAILAACGTTCGASGQTLTWINAAGGLASTAGNWSPAAVPASGNDLVFNLAGPYAVTFNSSAALSRTHTYRAGTVTLTMSAPHTASTGLIIGSQSGDSATATLTTGTWSSTSSVIIGSFAGSAGTLGVNDDDADLLITGAGADLTVGSNGAGTLNVTGGGLVQVQDQFIAGNNATSVSHVTVSGATSTLPLVRSTLDVLGTVGPSRLGQGGDATVAIANGGLARFAGDVVISNGSASTSTVTIGGLGGLIPQKATLLVGSDLALAANTSAGAAAGTATLNVNLDGVCDVGGTLRVGGDPDGGSATLHLSDGGRITTVSMAVGDGGQLDLDGGALSIDGGALTFSGGVGLIAGGAGRPVVALDHGAIASSPLTVGIALLIGAGAGANAADMIVRNGSSLSVPLGSLVLGEGSDDDAGLFITSGGSLSLGQLARIVVGSGGDAELDVNGGGGAAGGSLDIAAGSTSTALVRVRDAGSTAAFNALRVGVDGHASLWVENGGLLTVSGAASIPVSASSELKVYGGGALEAPAATISVQGLLAVEPASPVTAGALNILPAGELRGPEINPGAATVDAQVHLLGSATLVLTAGDLSLGRATSAAGFAADLGSLVQVGSRRLTLLDIDEAILAETTIAGGELVAPRGIDLVDNTGITGSGSITTPRLFFNSGGSVLTATGGGLVINGTLVNNSGTINGTRFTFNDAGAGGGWTGAGTIGARVVFNQGTTINALANMTIGANTADGVTFNAGTALHADTETITLLDSNGLALPSVTDLFGGRIVCAQPLSVPAGRRLSGRGGSVDAPIVTVLGTLSPGELVGVPAGETGELTINGILVLGSSADISIEIGGPSAPVQYDRVAVNGALALNGDLHVSEINGFHLPSGEALVIMEADSITGGFRSVSLPPAYQLTVTTRTVVVGHCVADFNGDGFIDFFDYDDFVECFETFNEGVCANGGNPDTNRDGFVDFFDYDDFVSGFETGC